MNRRIIQLSGLAVAVLCLAIFLRCDYSASENFEPADGAPAAGSLPGAVQSDPGNPLAGTFAADRGDDERKAILEAAMTLIQRATLQPGGENFKLAVQKLNHYFEGTTLSAYQLESAAHEYLKTQMPPDVIAELADRNWSLRDTRHIEDCMMYYPIANRVAGPGENLARVRRVFEWVVQQVQLVPAGALASGALPQAFARPYDVLLRGMATEAEGVWAERAWLFMALCRQLEIDAGLITYTPRNSLVPAIPKYGASHELEAALFGLRRRPKPPVVWICAALIDGKLYLFDARLGLEIPGPGGVGVATLDDAMSDSSVLERMNLPGESPYGTSRASLLGSKTKIGILLDSSRGYYSPKMKLLQHELGGKYRTILYRDAADQRDQFAQALGERAGAITFWSLPFEVETRLFTDGQFVKSIQASLFLFQREFPLVYARVKQLRGDLDEAIQEYVTMRFAENASLVNDKEKKTKIRPDIQAGLDAYATYYMALAHLEKARLDRKSSQRAAELFQNTLGLLPEPGPKQPYYQMLRWGANANLARIFESQQHDQQAIAHATQWDPTTQGYGNLLRARELALRHPLAAAPASIPKGPASTAVMARPATPAQAPGPIR